MSIAEFLNNHGVFFEENVQLSKKTWIKTGGTCDCWIVPDSVHQLEDVCKYLYSNKIAFDIVGQTSNIFFHSTYNPKTVVSTVKVNNYEINDGIITCDCGVNVAKFSRECLEAGYSGFYGLVGLPGTVAASVYGNAGCFDCSIVSMLTCVDVLLPDGIVHTFGKEELGYTHRSSAFKRKEIQGIILSVKLKVEKAKDLAAEKRKSEKTVVYRKTKQEKPNWCLGSVFSSRNEKQNVKNHIANLMAKILAKLKITDQGRAYKRLLLRLYGYYDLNPYISDKNVNTFVWRDEKAEQKFERYKELMGKVYDNLMIEIEEKTIEK